MDQEPVACTYIFTLEEFKKTQLLARRLAPLSEKLYLLGIVIFFGFAIGIIIVDLIRSKGPTDYTFLLPVAVFAYMVIYVACRVIPLPAFYKTGAFKKSGLRDTRVTNRLSPEGVGSETHDSKTLIPWLKIPRSVESKEGIAVYYFANKKSFIWFPYHGFPNSEEIDRCRVLLQEHVKDFRRL